MASHDEPQGDPSLDIIRVPSNGDSAESAQVFYEQKTDTPYYSSDYNYGPSQPGLVTPQTIGALERVGVSTPPPESLKEPPKASLRSGNAGSGGGGRKILPPPDGDNDEEESGMLRMSFLEHLEELRRRIFYALIGFAAAFLLSLTFCQQLWRIVSAPAVAALTSLGIHPPNLAQITPMESFNVVWVKTPVLSSIFVSSPWLLYQVWAFISPGLYKRERKWAVPFVLCTAGLFISGGMFAYFVAFRFGLTFLLGIGRDINVTPLVSINEYFDLFVNVTLGIGLVFELPVLIFFLTLLRLVTPRFLITHSRYAILAITIIAAVVTPTPDVFNLLLFATPMILLFFVGVFASYLLVLSREGRRFPWRKMIWPLVGLIVAALGVFYLLSVAHFHFIPRWPFFTR